MLLGPQVCAVLAGKVDAQPRRGIIRLMVKILHDLKDLGIMVYSLLWVMQDFVHQPYQVAPSMMATTVTVL